MPKHGSLVSSKVMLKLKLSVDSSYDAGTYGAATLTDSETQAFLDSDRGDQLNVHLNVVARHAHLSAFRQRHTARNVRGTEVEAPSRLVEQRSR